MCTTQKEGTLLRNFSYDLQPDSLAQLDFAAFAAAPQRVVFLAGGAGRSSLSRDTQAFG
jgi:hypothetical protein